MVIPEYFTMPWLHVTVPAGFLDAVGLADDLARDVSAAAGLGRGDVVTLITVADASATPGALVMLAGRRREKSVEMGMVEAACRTVVRAVGVSADLVAVVRL